MGGGVQILLDGHDPGSQFTIKVIQSTILGPMIVLLLILTFEPCVLNRIVHFVKNKRCAANNS